MESDNESATPAQIAAQRLAEALRKPAFKDMTPEAQQAFDQFMERQADLMQEKLDDVLSGVGDPPQPDAGAAPGGQAPPDELGLMHSQHSKPRQVAAGDQHGLVIVDNEGLSRIANEFLSDDQKAAIRETLGSDSPGQRYAILLDYQEGWPTPALTMGGSFEPAPDGEMHHLRMNKVLDMGNLHASPMVLPGDIFLKTETATFLPREADAKAFAQDIGEIVQTIRDGYRMAPATEPEKTKAEDGARMAPAEAQTTNRSDGPTTPSPKAELTAEQPLDETVRRNQEAINSWKKLTTAPAAHENHDDPKDQAKDAFKAAHARLKTDRSESAKQEYYEAAMDLAKHSDKIAMATSASMNASPSARMLMPRWRARVINSPTPGTNGRRSTVWGVFSGIVA